LTVQAIAAIGRDRSIHGFRVDGLSKDPRPPDAKKLKGDVGYSLRIGSYQVLYDINDVEHRVTIFRIRSRREAYR
jgi:mRNA interferase RelE/StbE